MPCKSPCPMETLFDQWTLFVFLSLQLRSTLQYFARPLANAVCRRQSTWGIQLLQVWKSSWQTTATLVNSLTFSAVTHAGRIPTTSPRRTIRPWNIQNCSNFGLWRRHMIRGRKNGSMWLFSSHTKHWIQHVRYSSRQHIQTKTDGQIVPNIRCGVILSIPGVISVSPVHLDSLWSVIGQRRVELYQQNVGQRVRWLHEPLMRTARQQHQSVMMIANQRKCA